jgi:hypothetical protein
VTHNALLQQVWGPAYTDARPRAHREPATQDRAGRRGAPRLDRARRRLSPSSRAS